MISRRLWVMDRASREGGKRRLPGDVAADDAQGAGEGEPVRIVPGIERGLVHQVPQRVVDQQEREDLLFDHPMGAGNAAPFPGRPDGS